LANVNNTTVKRKINSDCLVGSQKPLFYKLFGQDALVRKLAIVAIIL